LSMRFVMEASARVVKSLSLVNCVDSVPRSMSEVRRQLHDQDQVTLDGLRYGCRIMMRQSVVVSRFPSSCHARPQGVLGQDSSRPMLWLFGTPGGNEPGCHVGGTAATEQARAAAAAYAPPMMDGCPPPWRIRCHARGAGILKSKY
jgi:hypothetical protein